MRVPNVFAWHFKRVNYFINRSALTYSNVDNGGDLAVMVIIHPRGSLQPFGSALVTPCTYGQLLVDRGKC